MILAGDLNFTLNTYEIWGIAALTDPLTLFFKDLFDNSPLVDVALAELVPTWCNGRLGDSSIAKRLDRFFVVEDLIGPAMRYRHGWILPSYLIMLLFLFNWILAFKQLCTLLCLIQFGYRTILLQS
jgi:hypothetical protein